MHIATTNGGVVTSTPASSLRCLIGEGQRVNMFLKHCFTLPKTMKCERRTHDVFTSFTCRIESNFMTISTLRRPPCSFNAQRSFFCLFTAILDCRAITRRGAVLRRRVETTLFRFLSRHLVTRVLCSSSGNRRGGFSSCQNTLIRSCGCFSSSL